MKELITFRKYLNEGVIKEDELDDLLADLDDELNMDNPTTEPKGSVNDQLQDAKSVIKDHFFRNLENQLEKKDYTDNCEESYNTSVIYEYSKKSDGYSINYFMGLFHDSYGLTLSDGTNFVEWWEKNELEIQDELDTFIDSLYNQVDEFVKDLGVEVWDAKQVAVDCASSNSKSPDNSKDIEDMDEEELDKFIDSL